MNPFENTTLSAGVFSPDANLLNRTARVMEWCMDLFKFKRSVLFCHDVPPPFYSGESIQTGIVVLSSLNAMLPMICAALDSDTLFVHEDGFILEPERFEPAFIEYDFIGAPWPYGRIMNNGFCWQSQAFQRACMKLPFQKPACLTGTDVWLTDVNHDLLETMGIRFAPRDVALRFSTDVIGHENPSFGFHGVKHHVEKYELGWEKIKRWQTAGKPFVDATVQKA